MVHRLAFNAIPGSMLRTSMGRSTRIHGRYGTFNQNDLNMHIINEFRRCATPVVIVPGNQMTSGSNRKCAAVGKVSFCK